MEARESIEQRPDTAHERSLDDWTSSDNAMRWAGERLGVFGDGRIPADAVLAHDNRLRRALFDVLLNLVEGGVADIRGTERGYEFKARADDEVAWLAPAGPTIDLTAPAPLSEELRQACRERDEALRRAAVAEALAAERERILMRFAASTEIHVVRHEDELDDEPVAEAGVAPIAEPVAEPALDEPRPAPCEGNADGSGSEEAVVANVPLSDEPTEPPVEEQNGAPIVDTVDGGPPTELTDAGAPSATTGTAESDTKTESQTEPEPAPAIAPQTTEVVATSAPPTEPVVPVVDAPAPAPVPNDARRRWPWVVAAIVLFAVAVLAAIVGAAYIARRSGPLFLPDATTDARQNAAAAVSFGIAFVALVLRGLVVWTIARRRARSSIASS